MFPLFSDTQKPDPTAVREVYFAVWQKLNVPTEPQNLTPLERQMGALIAAHPEYHEVFSQPEKYKEYVFRSELGETNPFLHVGLHISILEQIQTNRPKGITALYKELVETFGDAHHAEHHMMEILSENVRELINTPNATQQDLLAGDKKYLKQLKKLLKHGCQHHHSH